MFSQVTFIKRPVIVTQRKDSLNYIHHKVLHNFANTMSCSVEDIDRVIYVISSHKLTINSIRVVLTDDTDYIFTYDNSDADGRPEDIAYTTDVRIREARSHPEWDDPEEIDYKRGVVYCKSYRAHLSELNRLPRSITKRIGARKLMGDLTISLPTQQKSFTKHNKVLVKIDRRRRKGNQEIYKEWDEIIAYYPITVVDYAYPDEPIIATDDEPSVCAEPIKYPSIEWSDDEPSVCAEPIKYPSIEWSDDEPSICTKPVKYPSIEWSDDEPSVCAEPIKYSSIEWSDDDQ